MSKNDAKPAGFVFRHSWVESTAILSDDAEEIQGAAEAADHVLMTTLPDFKEVRRWRI